MYVPRLLLLSLLISLCVATAAAQSSPNNNSDSSQRAFVLPRNPQASTAPFQFQLPFLADGQNLSDDQGTVQRGNAPLVTPPLDIQAMDSLRHNLTLQQDEKACFTIRAYRVVRESPDSDTTKPAGYSTCQPTNRFQLKQAVETQVVVPR